MGQIVVEVKDKEKMLYEFLTALDFVKTVKTLEQENQESQQITSDQTTDFFSIAGLWADRDVSIQSIRKKAWPRYFS